MARRMEQRKTTHNTGKPMVGWWTEKKECNCGKTNCKRAGGQACVRRSKRNSD